MKPFGIYNYINGLSSPEKLNYVYLSVVLFFGISLYEINMGHILSLLFIPVIIIFLIDQKYSRSSDFFSKLESRLNQLDDTLPDQFHTDPDMVNLFYEIRDFRDYNKSTYNLALKETNLVLQLKVKSENDDLKNPVDVFEEAEIKSKKALNHMHAFIFAIPKTPESKEKLQKALSRHQLLLKRNLDFIFERCKALTKEVNTSTRFITDYGSEKPFNPENQLFGHVNFNVFPI